jgi:hypothetical protein
MRYEPACKEIPVDGAGDSAQQHSRDDRTNDSTQDQLCSAEWPPFTMRHDSVLDVGISADVIHAVFERMQIPVQIASLFWISCLQKVGKVQMDGAVDAFPSDRGVHGVNSTSYYPLALFVVSDSPIHDLQLGQMLGKKRRSTGLRIRTNRSRSEGLDSG